ncbi:DUF6602 domain-containing protein [Streptomyces sp. NPDC002054]|uniref:DUF6602 domain-containing protein n=1 Tax=Streptomyces sp. NPDC002054 TaxID=3154663 RepID=UPI00332866EB
MADNSLASILQSVAKKMRADYEQSRSIRHRGEAGGNREALVAELVGRRVPGHVEVLRSAEIVTVAGDVSPQCDVVVVDRSTPPLTDMEGCRVLPNECVYGVIEVKTTLNREQLIDACNKIRAVKRLEKTAYFGTHHPQRVWSAYGKTHIRFPTAGLIFAFEAIGLDTLGEHFAAWCSDVPPDERPDSIWVLGKGYLTWGDRESVAIRSRAVDHDPVLVAMDQWHDDDILLAFTVHLNELFSTAEMAPFRLKEYAAHHPLGVVRRVWQAEDQPS